MKLKLFSVSAALCVSMLITNAQPGQAQLQALEPLEPQWMTDMYTQGWQKVAEGVLQRSEGEGSPLESFFYNQDGLLWRVQQLQNQVGQLETLYSTSPSADLARLITDVENEISSLNDRIGSGQAEPFTGEETANCTINYGATADAHWLTGTSAPGVTGTATAYFNSTCGHYGKVYASVYVLAVLGSVTSTKTQTDDKPESTSVSAYAQFSATGNTSCYSYAVGRSESSALNILYTVEDSNYLCPETPVVTVTGTPHYYTSYSGSNCATATWNATVSGAGSYTINWYIGGVHQGSGPSLSKQYCNTNQAVTATAAVTANGVTVQGSYTSNIHYLAQPQDPCLAYGDCGCGGGYNQPFQPYQYEICR